KKRRRIIAGAQVSGLRVEAAGSLPDTLVDEVDQRVDALRRDGTSTRVHADTRHLVLHRQDTLQHGQEALEIEELVQRRRNVTRFQAADRRWSKVDAADNDLAGLLARLLEDVGELAGDVAMLRPDRLQIRVRLDVGGEDRHGEGRIAVHFLADIEAVDL